MKNFRSAFGWLAFTLLCRFPSLTGRVLDEDEAWYHVFGHVLRAGGTAYRDAIDVKPPLLYWIYALISRGHGLLAIHYFALLTTAATAWFLQKALRRSGASARTALIGAAIFPAYSSAFWPHAFAANAEWLASLPLAIAFWLAPHAQQRRDALGCGVALALAAGIKQQAILLLPCLWVVLPAEALLGTVAGGVLVGVAAVALLSGLHHEAFYWIFVYSQTLWHDLELATVGARAWEVAGLFALSWLPLWLSVGAVRPTRRWAFAAAVASMILAVALGGKFFPHYFVLILVPLIVTARTGLERASRLPAALWIALILTPPAVAIHRYYQREAYVDAVNDRRAKALALYLAEHAGAGERVQIWGRCPEILVFSNHLPASGFFATNFLVGMNTFNFDRPADPQTVHQHWRLWGPTFLADLMRSQPRFIVDTAPAGWRQFGKYPLKDFPELDAFVRSAYVEETRIMKAVIYRRK